jgi:hypothetical protein
MKAGGWATVASRWSQTADRLSATFGGRTATGMVLSPAHPRFLHEASEWI